MKSLARGRVARLCVPSEASAGGPSGVSRTFDALKENGRLLLAYPRRQASMLSSMIIMATKAKSTTWTLSISLPPIRVVLRSAWTWLAGPSTTMAHPCKRGNATETMAQTCRTSNGRSIIINSRGSGKHPPAREKNWSSAEARKYPFPAPTPHYEPFPTHKIHKHSI